MAENNQANAPAQEQDLSEILKVRREKLAALRAEGRDPFQQTRFDVSHHAQDIKDHFDELEGTEVTVGGRLMSKRGMGKVSFCDLQDKSGRIQIYARKDEMDEEEYNRFKKYDIGDIVGVRGEVFRTQRGEMSVRAKENQLLSLGVHTMIGIPTPICAENAPPAWAAVVDFRSAERQLEQYCAWLRRFSKCFGAECIDFRADFFDPNGRLKRELLLAGLHPTPEGHQIMARRLSAHLKRERQG